MGDGTQRQDKESSGTDGAVAFCDGALRAKRGGPVRSVSGLTGGNACLYEQYRQEGKSLLGEVASLAVGMALSCSEINASMQCIVACPTAGSCGIVPAAVLACAQSRGLDRECMVNALFTASAIGIIIGSRATVSGGRRARRNAGGCGHGGGGCYEMLGGSPGGIPCCGHGSEKCTGTYL
ncbi:MAG: L-serine ammonia-lyase, iron-sulfur-dependent, subunit alpha [Eisenbergiella massiliensis]